MKKALVVMLTLCFVVSMTGAAFAFDGGWFSKWRSGAAVKGDIKKKIEFENKVEARSGDAYADGNCADNMVMSNSEAKSDGSEGAALNTTTRKINNVGQAEAWSEKADALNNVTNTDKEYIEENATTTSDCSICIDASVETGGMIPNHAFVDSNRDGKCDICGDCCPATVDGDICVDVEFENKAEARTGDAYATGNVASNMICSSDKALACDGGCANNESTIEISNIGTAKAWSETATATNNVENRVTIDIFRNASASKTTDIFAELSAKLMPMGM